MDRGERLGRRLSLLESGAVKKKKKNTKKDLTRIRWEIVVCVQPA
jgi:hypothetical protein